MSAKIGILLSGLGAEKGTQILELSFIYREIERGGTVPLCLIPTEITPVAGRGRTIKPRDLFEECAPVVRGEAVPVENIEPKELRALIIPGGRGPITVLSNIAEAGSDARIVRSVQNLIVGMHVRKRLIGTIGYGGALVMVALKQTIEEPIITLGEDAALTADLSSLGIPPVNVGPQEVIIDQQNLIFSTAGISANSSLAKASNGIEILVKGILKYKEKKKS